MGNYVIGVGNYMIATPSELGNYKIADTWIGAGRAWQRNPGRLPPDQAPGGPFLTRPGLLGPCARATTEQPSGQNGHERNDLES
jgi:hypothetical protein